MDRLACTSGTEWDAVDLVEGFQLQPGQHYGRVFGQLEGYFEQFARCFGALPLALSE